MKNSFARRARRRAPAIIVAIILATVTGFAVTANGHVVKKLELHDTGIWITNDADGYYGRLNKAALGLDATPRPPGQPPIKYELEILQDGNLVAGWDQTDAKLTAINTATVTNNADGAVSISPNSQVEMRGGTLAVMDRTGKVWAERYDKTAIVLDLQGVDQSQKPLADLKLSQDAPETASSLAVGVDGTVYVASTGGAVITIPVVNSALGKPEQRQDAGGLKSIQVAAVGATLVRFDALDGRLFLDGGRAVSVAQDQNSRLQFSGDQSSTVLVASGKELDRVDLSSGTITSLDQAGDGAPARPVHLSSCDYGAWAGAGHAVRACASSQTETYAVDRTGGLTRPVFRINHGLITLNDAATGRAFDFDTKSSLDNWQDVRPQSQTDQGKKTKQVNAADAKPKAVRDDLKARPDRTTILHVLDNDTDTAGGVLSIKSINVAGVPAGVKVDIAPDGQTLKFYLPSQVQSADFHYTITNGRADAEGEVSVANAGTSNSPPKTRDGYTVPDYTAPSFGNLSIPVVGDWRDPEGDPVAVVSAVDEKGAVVPVTADGRIEFTAGLEATAVTKSIKYQVTDGVGDVKPDEGVVTVNVLASTEVRSTPAVANPDSVIAQVGKAIALTPLANDVPGADPRNPQAKLVLAAAVDKKPDIGVTTDIKSGQVIVTAAKAGPYFLEYQVGFGSAATAKGTIFVNAVAAEGQGGPVAMPDQASVHGVGAVLVDVLANDFDPSGSLLTVQSVTPQNPDMIQAAVISGRWLRIVPLSDTLSPNPQVIHYTVSNGSQEASGDVMVTQLPGVGDDQPLVRDDFAAVRDNDSVLIPVLSNDTSLSGAPLTLVTNLAGVDSPGQLKVIDPSKKADENQGDVGKAFVHSGQVRYVAPAHVDEVKQVQIEYIAQTGAGNTAVGHVTVTINPQPATPEADQAPVPQTVEIRVVSGSRIAIPIPTSGSDPDGDTVTVTGITSAPTLGRVVGISPTSLTYEAYPTAGLVGTDTFTFEVTDRYGKSGQASIRVAVVAPGQTQPPVAMDDTMVAKPGAQLQVNVMSNDLYGRDDSVTVAPLNALNSNLPSGVSLAAEKGPIVAKAPDANSQPLVVLYALKGNGGTGPSASVTITSKDGYKNAPVITDQTATADGKNATVDALTNAWDPDGDTSALTVKVLADVAGLTLSGSTVSVPMLDHAQVIPFQVTDADGASNGAVIYVPATGAGAPVLKSGGTIDVAKNASVTVAISDYVTSPLGKTIKIAAADVAASPSDVIAAQAVDADRLTVTAKNDYVGPGAIVVQVMDANSQTDPGVLKATVSIPVQVGPKTPVLRCPASAQTIMQGGEAKALDITTLCHVWSPNPDDLASVTYSATWSKPLQDVTAQGNAHKVTLQAGNNAVENASGSLTIGVAGTDAKTAELAVEVLPAPQPTMQSQTISDVKQGTPVTVQLGLSSPLLHPEPTIISVAQSSGPTATESHSGTTMTITPDASVSGTIVFAVTASDVSSPDRQKSRTITRNITLVVYGKPDAPAAPQAGQTVQSHSTTLTWSAPKSNGAPIDSYEIDCSNGAKWTSQSTTVNATGLANNVPVTFTVKAHNKGGWSDPGPSSRSVTPDVKPGAPTGVTASNPQDGTLTLSWSPLVNDGSPVKLVHITWAGGSTSAAGAATSTTITGLVNDQKYTFTVWAENNLGPGPNGSGSGQSSGKPKNLSVTTPTPLTPIGAATAVQVSWAAADPNGPGPVTYSAKRSDGKQICTSVTGTSCTDDTVTYSGATYTYTVTAVNATGEPHSATATSPSWKATGTPDNWGAWTVNPTGANSTVHLAFTVPPARGSSSTVTIYAGGTLVKTMPGPVAGGADVADIGGLSNGTPYSMHLQVCNDSNKCSQSGSQSVTPFGSLLPPSISASLSGTTATATASANGNGADATLTITRNGTVLGTTSGTGQLSVTGIQDIGYNASAAYVATLTTGGTTPARTSPGAVTSNTVTTPAPPRVVSIAWSGTANGTSEAINLSTQNFVGSYTCTMKQRNSAGGPLVAVTGVRQGAVTSMTYSTNLSNNQDFFGFSTGSYPAVVIVCNGVESNELR